MNKKECIHLHYNLYHGKKLVSAGKLVSNWEREFSSFGKHYKISLSESDEESADIFVGLTLSHVYDGEWISLTLRLYDIEEEDDVYFGLKQVQLFESEMRIGKYSGAEKVEAIMIGEDFQFDFQTKILP